MTKEELILKVLALLNESKEWAGKLNEPEENKKWRQGFLDGVESSISLLHLMMFTGDEQLSSLWNQAVSSSDESKQWAREIFAYVLYNVLKMEKEA